MRQEPKTKALVLAELNLSKRQLDIINSPTPAEFVKERPIRGGKKAKYVEVGYVISRLNQAFGPLNWEFEVLDSGKENRKVDGKAEGEVWIRGKLSVKDHTKGYSVGKTQYGQHPIYPGVPVGDAYKSAESDALKKCASMFGVALDIYWGVMEDEAKGEKQEKPEISKAELFDKAKKMILACKDEATLVNWRNKIHDSKIYDNQQKVELMSLINAKIQGK